MATPEIPFYNPVHPGAISLGLTQTDKIISFKSLVGVFIPESSVSVYYKNTQLKEYTIGDGITIVGTNTTGIEKTANCVLQGADFDGFKGCILRLECTFFIDGDIEIIFNLVVS